MTTGLHPGETPQEPRPTENQPLPRQEAVPGSPHVENRTRSSVITARAAASFTAVSRSVATARSFVRDTLHGWGFADIVDDAVVLTSELVTNAVVHAGTSADVLCLRADDGVRIEVADRYPEREIPLQGSHINMGSPDREGGRGLQLCAAMASRWGVEYTSTHKQVWFQLDLPDRPVGTRSAGPALPADLLPLADGRVRVAVVQIDRVGAIGAWNEDAEELFGYPPDQVIGKPLTDLAAWPHTPGTSTGVVEALQLSRWEGSYGIRCANGRVTPVYASHLRVRDTGGDPSTVCLLVQDHERAVLQTPIRMPSGDGSGSGEGQATDPFEVFIGSPAPDDLDGLLQRTVERARDMLDGDSAFLLLATDDETELEVRASTGLPSARQRFARVPVDAGPGRYGSARMPAVHDDLTAVPGAVPLLNGTGMRSVVTVPLKVEGRLTGSLGVAAESQGRYSNEEALRLQFAADRIALAVESARLGELERLRRGSLSFLVEASDLLAGTLDRDQTLALMAQMTIPTLATWCAVYTIADQASDPYLSYVLHEDEDLIDGLKALLSKIRPPEPIPTPGARVWTAPAEAAHQAALRTSMRSLGLGEPATVSSGIGTTLATASAVGGETVVLPLVARNRVIGMLTLGKPTDEHFRQEILELAEDLSRRAALALDNARLYSERVAISQSLQRSLLPPELPQIDGVEVEVIYRAAGEGNEVGGDFYDLFPIRDGAYGFAIGDVCGTGPEAAAVTGLARHALRLLAREGYGGPAVLERLNSAIIDEGARSRFLTLLYGELWPQEDGSAVLKVVCAGHPLPLRLRQDGTVEPAAEPQALLGVMEDLELYEQTVTLDPGDVLLCVTDGVTERREGTRMLGDDGLTEVLTACTGLTAGAVAARVMRAVERFASDAPSDDMAILAMRVPGLQRD
ncbi:SpoIIE family protein phosphatase [Streptomyces europaeiscabiei]|uniref:SpoIIE family protein phosphatase n=1 Tax=Streptomyces europaeiscabiei TaxID=146819 RepID=UPI0006283D3F|nr:SpoIIE family protein phosphatase [Streptomyces europaeiscabiei]MDX2523062.1 SpoIIE family protein phosphatase [Streptomyces europaeiscabiei]MDX2761996.1 SpoIIE family protein phosphatase [Streptomyces europaeiscabiei]MDX2771615.1 SpoIIE family protein phosphatase [Streptomyces europaeiscabiei]MDX3664433.1 SpoIIE family protein phosphatase [Streptomyces europaeiscabiei]MDX3781608.1 SpoIIE family protein phosphatase [Streptomyces europaeiscabiei]